ncbi:protein-tyrosine phosphatase family protein [Austwickia chelonae]|uniref:protein-tyrosine phosphatase family protein n=1 Tax=Austwickia chelonae TaxID=100225 RepID=UPI000E239263|nr:protein-tyrosine phosphatase family protein [Austwickia chelonae]
MSDAWESTAPGVVTFPSGRRVRGRGLRAGVPEGPLPGFGVYLTTREPSRPSWDSRWVRWPDFWVPRSRPDAVAALAEAWGRATTDRVEIACGGGVGRTGTALALLAVFDGVEPDRAVAFVRDHYDPRAVEVPWQRSFVERIGAGVRRGQPHD